MGNGLHESFGFIVDVLIVVFLIGGIKVWIRLNYKCCGNVYYIDEP